MCETWKKRALTSKTKVPCPVDAVQFLFCPLHPLSTPHTRAFRCCSKRAMKKSLWSSSIWLCPLLWVHSIIRGSHNPVCLSWSGKLSDRFKLSSLRNLEDVGNTDKFTDGVYSQSQKTRLTSSWATSPPTHTRLHHSCPLCFSFFSWISSFKIDP